MGSFSEEGRTQERRGLDHVEERTGGEGGPCRAEGRYQERRGWNPGEKMVGPRREQVGAH